MKFTDMVKRARGDAPVNRVAARAQAQLAVLTSTATIPQQRTGEAIREIDPDSWATVAQAGELSFHKRPNMRSSASWEDDIARDWMELGFEADAWADKLIIDVG